MENIADQEMTLYYQIDYTLTEVPDDAAYLHAQFRRVNPLPYKQDYTIVDGVKGEGQFVGTHMSWGVNNTGWWGEGEIKFFIDGDTDYPTICGTGTEDYFCGSYNFENQADQAVPGVLDAVLRAAAGRPARRRLPVAAALRPVPLAHHGPDPLRAGPARDDPGARLAHRRPLPAAAGRHRVGGVLVSGRAARARFRRCRGEMCWRSSESGGHNRDAARRQAAKALGCHRGIAESRLWLYPLSGFLADQALSCSRPA